MDAAQFISLIVLVSASLVGTGVLGINLWRKVGWFEKAIEDISENCKRENGIVTKISEKLNKHCETPHGCGEEKVDGGSKEVDSGSN